ncbi:MAG: hypothetical protein GF364_15565, partial [Candidatus Lokiarchaeota archaeon]|nr:hypothetical protein [Candidatus Lokiarchaeota archaeon]
MTRLRVLGNSCLELVDSSHHIIIDPVYSVNPKKGIDTILITHEHDDHLDMKYINEIKEEYAQSKQELKIYAPKPSQKKMIQAGWTDGIKVIDQDLMILQEDASFSVEAMKINCYKAKACYSFRLSSGNIHILHTADAVEFTQKLRKYNNSIDYCFISCFEDYFENYLQFVKDLRAKMIYPYHFRKGKNEFAKRLAEFLKKNEINSKFIKIGT